jgi:hypothetical protein
MATTKSQAIETPSRLLIQIDDLVREMTDEEYANYLLITTETSETK